MEGFAGLTCPSGLNNFLPVPHVEGEETSLPLLTPKYTPRGRAGSSGCTPPHQEGWKRQEQEDEPSGHWEHWPHPETLTGEQQDHPRITPFPGHGDPNLLSQRKPQMSHLQIFCHVVLSPFPHLRRKAQTEN